MEESSIKEAGDDEESNELIVLVTTAGTKVLILWKHKEPQKTWAASKPPEHAHNEHKTDLPHTTHIINWWRVGTVQVTLTSLL